MMENTLKKLCNLMKGTVIEGKWHKNQYIIMKQLGFGANGVVYLARWNQRYVAVKISDNSMSITSEVNVLKVLNKVQGSQPLGPYLLDVDDWIVGNKKIHFYVMEYIEGPGFLSFIQKEGKVWTKVLILQLLADLHKLHQSGWIFGDLKPENLIVTGPAPRLRCIDVGGTTLKGRAIKEFTEFYDRGYWGLGTRKAEPSYDLFSVAMIWINTEYPKRFQKTTGGIKQLEQMIKQKHELLFFEKPILKALKGKYQSANEMRQEILQIIQKDHRNQGKNVGQITGKSLKKKKKGKTVETFFIVAIIFLLYFIYLMDQLSS